MTAHHEYFLNRQIQTVLYTLKRQYGGPITVFHVLSRETDTKTGEPAARYRATRISRAIVLPARISRDVERSISLISANKQMVMGGWFDSGKRLFILDRRDTALTVEKDDFLVYDGCKYAVDTIDEYEFASAYSVVAKKLLGETFDDSVLIQHLDAANGVAVEEAAGQFRVLTHAGTDAITLESNSGGEV
jgi:hypothetical protein